MNSLLDTQHDINQCFPFALSWACVPGNRVSRMRPSEGKSFPMKTSSLDIAAYRDDPPTREEEATIIPSDSSCIVEESYLSFQPSLAILVGVESAIILQRIQFLCSTPRSGRIIDGYRYIWNTYEQWRDQHFPFWSIDIIKKKMILLEREGWLVTRQPDGVMSRKKYYRLSEGFKRKATIRMAAESAHNPLRIKGPPDGADSHHRIGKSARSKTE